jgi:hypothetical protein
MGTGTTGIACQKFNPKDTMVCIGSELSEKQVEYSRERLEKYVSERENEINFEYDEHD